MTQQISSKRVLIIDDHAVVLRGLTAITREALDNDVVIDTAASGHEAKQLLTTNYYRLCLFDVELPDIDGMTFLHTLRCDFPDIRIIVHTMHEQLWYLDEFVAMNVEGIVFKSSDVTDLIKAIKRVFNGLRFYCSSALALKSELASHIFPTVREKDILELISRGMTTHEIAAKLGVTPHAVEFHRRNLLYKFNANNVAELIAKAYEQGFAR
ncbi:MAG: response regulator transcription factor [Prevotella sp.]